MTTQTKNGHFHLEEMTQSAAEAAAMMRALSNEGRLLVLCHLVEGPKTVGELERALGYSQPHVSQLLARLRHEGFVDSKRHGRSVQYSIADDRLRAVIMALHEAFCPVNNANGSIPATGT